MRTYLIEYQDGGMSGTLYIKERSLHKAMKSAERNHPGAALAAVAVR